MKVRFYPKAETVKSILREDLAFQEGSIVEADTKLAQINNSGLLIVGNEAQSYSHLKASAERNKADIQRRLDLLEAHAPPEVMVEFDL